MPDVDALVNSLLENLAEEEKQDIGYWIVLARESAAAEVERDLLATARDLRNEFSDAAALVERIISE